MTTKQPTGEHLALTGEHPIVDDAVPEKSRNIDHVKRPDDFPHRLYGTLDQQEREFPRVRVVECMSGAWVLSPEVWRLVDRSGLHRNTANLAGPTLGDSAPLQKRRQVPMHDVVFVDEHGEPIGAREGGGSPGA